MTRWLTALRSWGSLAGFLIIGLGMFLLYENATGVIAALTSQGAVRVLPAILLWVSQVSESCAGAHDPIVKAMLQQTVTSAWPLALVVIGTVLARLP